MRFSSLVFLTFTLSQLSHAFIPSERSLMTFMREAGKEKQIMTAKADGTQVQAITKGKLWHLYPTINPAGTEVTFVAGESESSLHLVTQNLETSSQEQWTLENQKGLNLHPSYSGNGQWIVFSQEIEKKNRISFFNIEEARKNSQGILIETEDGPRTLIAPKIESVESEYPAYFPNFSSDASFLVYQRSIPKTENSPAIKDIVLYDLATKKLTQITDPKGYSMAPAISPDDRYIAYTALVKYDDKENWDIYVKDRYSDKVYRVTEDAGMDYAPTFTAGNSIVFASARTGHFNLYKISAASWMKGILDESHLINVNADDYAPSLSGDRNFTQKELAHFADPARSSFGAIKHGDRIYIVGGHQGHEHTYPPESFMDTVEYYDLKTGIWGKAAPRLHKAHGFEVETYGKYIYAFGGFAYDENNKPKWKSLDVIERFDTEKNIWEVVGKMPRKRSSNVVVKVGNKAYIIGGWDSTPKTPGDLEGTFHRAIDVFNFEDETITEAKFTLPDPLRRAFTAVEHNGKIILVGGLGVGASHFELLSNMTEIDPATGETKELKPLPFATFAPAAGVIDGELFVFGGMFKLSEMEYNYVPHIYSMDIALNRWSHTGRFLSEPKGFSQVLSIDSKTLGILGGHKYTAETDMPVSTFEIFQAK